jgi:hypothetical protein
MQGWQAHGRAKAIDPFHEIKGAAKGLSVGAGGDNPWVRNVRAIECAQHPCFADHCLVAIAAQVLRGSSQNKLRLAASKLNQNILSSSGQQHGI